MSRGEREALVILVGVGFFLGGRVAMVVAWRASLALPPSCEDWPGEGPPSASAGAGGGPPHGGSGGLGIAGLVGGSPGVVWGAVCSGVVWAHGGWPGGGPATPLPPLAYSGPAPPEAAVVFHRQLEGT